jgi:hypothetical protein
MYKIDQTYYTTGDDDVQRFIMAVNKVSKVNHWLATTDQDKYEHWDVALYDSNNIIKRIEVKGLKKNKRDGSYDDNIHWVEFKGILGHKGWIYGKADYVALECNDYWIIVDREKLANLAEDSVKNGDLVFDVDLARGNRYQRKKYGRLDEVTILYKDEILKISKKILYK